MRSRTPCTKYFWRCKGMRNTRRTALWSARITAMCAQSLANATWAHTSADKICAARLCCHGRATVKLPVKMQGKYSSTARCGVTSGLPYRTDQPGELRPTLPPTVMQIPRAWAVRVRQQLVQHGAPPSTQGQSTSKSHPTNRVEQPFEPSVCHCPGTGCWQKAGCL